MTRRLAPFAALAAAATLGLAACGGDDETATTAATTEPPPATTAPPPPPPPPPPPETTPKPESTTVTIVYRDGKVDGGIQRATYKVGDEVVLVVRSDVADEVHVHGYDKFANVTPGKVARLPFVASIPGRFEVELEERGLAIAILEVRP